MEIKDVIHHPDKSISLKKEDISETKQKLTSPIKGSQAAARMFLY